MHLPVTTIDFIGLINLSIPFTWDFSMHPTSKTQFVVMGLFTFNSLYLGFFHASSKLGFPLPATPTTTFNSLYLGFFHASLRNRLVGKVLDRSFNSLYLGFFHASSPTGQTFIQGLLGFQFPLLGIFPCIELERSSQRLRLLLSIPFTWDFSMHRQVPFQATNMDVIFQFPLLGIFPCILYSYCFRTWSR